MLRHPTVRNLSLPRLRLGGPIDLAAAGRSPGEFMIVDPLLYQWVGDHWEGVGAWSPGGRADDPLANYQQSRQGAMAFGGGGGTPAPRRPGDPSVTDALPPTFVNFSALDAAAVPRTATNYIAASGLQTLTSMVLGGIPTHKTYAVFTIPVAIAVVVPGSYNFIMSIGGVSIYESLGGAGPINDAATIVSFGIPADPGAGNLNLYINGATAKVTFQVIAGTYQVYSRGGLILGGGYS